MSGGIGGKKGDPRKLLLDGSRECREQILFGEDYPLGFEPIGAGLDHVLS